MEDQVSFEKSKNVFKAAYRCLIENDISTKCELTKKLYLDIQNGVYGYDSDSVPERLEKPGVPDNVELVMPQKLTQRSVHSKEGHASLIHSICHIEFNAINLALDAVYRFRDMPDDYYQDWAKVAAEEAYHFTMLESHLKSLGHQYGDFKAHNGLWRMALETAHDPLVRMALVPRVLEARGLDVTPAIIKKLHYIKDNSAIEILDIIFNDEVGHVAIGTKWFYYLCDERNVDKYDTFIELMNTYVKGKVRGPYHTEARIKAGFSEAELDFLQGL
ncbi:MAG: ferritin-like domain-containing protein [Gammaproteobacteria bacterium]